MSATQDPFDPTSKTLRPLGEYRDRLPSRRRGRRINRSTLYRWTLRGARGGSVRLHSVTLGGGRFTSDADFADFMRRLDSTPAPADSTPPQALQDRARQVRAEWDGDA